MAYKIAVASSDGKVINQHFGKATHFLIFEVNGSEFKCIDLIKTAPFCRSGEHDDEELLSAAEWIADCRTLIVSRIGKSALKVLNSKGLEVFEIGWLIEEALAKLIKYYAKIDGGRLNG